MKMKFEFIFSKKTKKSIKNFAVNLFNTGDILSWDSLKKDNMIAGVINHDSILNKRVIFSKI